MISNRLHKKNTDLFYWLFFIMDLDNIKKPKQKNRYCAISKCFMYLEV